MPESKNGHSQQNGKVKAPKAPTDYAKMLDDWEIRRDGLELRVNRLERHLREILPKDHVERVMQVITRPGDGYGAVVGKYTIALAQVDRYRRLKAANEVTPVTDVPTIPGNGETSAPASAPAAA